MNEFIGNEGVLAYLKHAFENGTLFHAFLFVGPDGIGKRTLAEMLARSLLCPQKQFGGCGECAACRHIANRTHPDFFYVSRPEDKMGVTIDQVRRLRESLSHTAFFAGPRVAVIDDSHTMNGNAANALLKQLEETPNVHFFLLAETVQSLPETIQSRVQRFDFHPLHRDALAGDPRFTTLSFGAPGRLKRFTGDEKACADESAFRDAAVTLFTASRTDRLKELDRVFGKATFAEQRNIANRLSPHLVSVAREKLQTSPDNSEVQRMASGILGSFRFFEDDVTPRILMERLVATT